MKTLTQTLLVSSLTAALWLTPAWAETLSADDSSNPASVNSAAPTVQPNAQATPSAQPMAGCGSIWPVFTGNRVSLYRLLMSCSR
ncbi:hypothetical protein FD733_11780 [Pantoea sp. Eser]|nr:hypothetical protein [Pantoea sp. Eser]